MDSFAAVNYAIKRGEEEKILNHTSCFYYERHTSHCQLIRKSLNHGDVLGLHFKEKSIKTDKVNIKLSRPDKTPANHVHTLLQ